MDCVGTEEVHGASQTYMLEKSVPILLEDPYETRMINSRNVGKTICSASLYVERMEGYAAWCEERVR